MLFCNSLTALMSNNAAIDTIALIFVLKQSIVTSLITVLRTYFVFKLSLFGQSTFFVHIYNMKRLKKENKKARSRGI